MREEERRSDVQSAYGERERLTKLKRGLRVLPGDELNADDLVVF